LEFLCSLSAVLTLFAVASSLVQPHPAQRVDIVSVAGCLRETAPGSWMLVDATDPVPSNANAPTRNEIPAALPIGKNQFRLIGVSEFDLPLHKDHGVIIKGLHIKAQPVNRLNVTSVTTIAPSCGGSK
jgi:hypothetical protein